MEFRLNFVSVPQKDEVRLFQFNDAYQAETQITVEANADEADFVAASTAEEGRASLVCR